MELFYDIFLGDNCVAREVPVMFANLFIQSLMGSQFNDGNLSATVRLSEGCAMQLRLILGLETEESYNAWLESHAAAADKHEEKE